ncbi:prolyl oligopeptidase family serine peptidase [Aurantibacter crassamenti]|uniref:carboxylesterase family protein n=1 Tax=Aurantibacter crassamenti TaxID=1837375 RepID=UPI001939E4E2|nr:prolyl oligopeptidase family serine peptidase [Aurantibacter crassamenti]MBM1106727.1 prolyl oligopeptidase family serine peptidase [Aurantibacter crassamenti]
MKSIVLLFIACVLMQSCKAQSKSMLIDASYESIVKEDFHYYLYYPESYESDENKDFPILLFLHGGGESGGELEEVKSNGPPKLIAEGNEFPFLILAPQNPHKKKWWNTQALIELLDEVVANNRVDKKRIYLTGLSRGGGAAWELAVQYPEKFAALAVVCGMAPLPYASWLDKEMPIWVFHGTEDQSIPFSESKEMVEKLKAIGHDVKFTAYEGVGHNSWEKAYTTEALYKWFIDQKRK